MHTSGPIIPLSEFILRKQICTTRIIITGLFLTKLFSSQPRWFREDTMLRVSSQKAQTH